MDLVSRLTDEFPFSEREVVELIRSAPARYKVHSIEKRNGRGTRLIAQPTAEIKLLQRWALAQYVDALPVHEAAIAYRRGRSILHHAKQHAGQAYLLKLDFRDFFPSILGIDLDSHFAIFSDIQSADRASLVQLFCWRRKPTGQLRLSIGAPSSPAISNTVMYQFDLRTAEYCSDLGVNYTRYADDLAFSTNSPRVLDQVHRFVQQLCKKLTYPRLVLHSGKTVFTSRKRNRQLTGLVLTNEGDVSLGREKKRELRAMVHRASIGQLDHDSTQRLRGLLAYVQSVEPEFLVSVERMIGKDALLAIIRLQPGK